MSMITSPDRSNTGAVVVTYHPDANFASRLCAIARQVDAVLIVDNASNAQEVEMIKQAASDVGAQVVLNEKNVGVATALNQGIEWAGLHGYAWLLTMDQDSTLYDDAVETMRRIFNTYDRPQDIGIIGSNFMDHLKGKPYYDHAPDDNRLWEEVVAVATSGSIVPLEVFARLGRFVDELFIDLVDYEYCLRAQANGLRVLRSIAPMMHHVLGCPYERRILFKMRVLSNIPPLRWYYMIRNLVYLKKRYLETDHKWIRRLNRDMRNGLRKVLYYEPDKWAKIRMAARGLIDGYRERMGPFRDN